MTTAEAAILWNVSERMVVFYVTQGRVKAERRFSRSNWWWEIPDGTPKPVPKPKSGGRPKKNPG